MVILIPVFLILTALLLICSKDALALAGMGLTLWLENMVPTLLPFMILSGIMTGLKLQYALCRPFRSLNRKLFSVSEDGTYCIVMGFLCGFPMGAFCASDLSRQQKLSQKDTEYLISFCNNIGPVYFYSFAVGMAGFEHPSVPEYLILTAGMYGIPLLYGIFTRPKALTNPNTPSYPPSLIKSSKNSSSAGYCAGTEKATPSSGLLFEAIDRSINRSGTSILRLCGYMVLFNILMLPCYRFLGQGIVTRCIHCFVEISGGIRMLHPLLTAPKAIVPKLMILTALSFGGLSCIGQTSVFLREAGLSVAHYMKARILLAALTFLYYLIWFSTGFLN